MNQTDKKSINQSLWQHQIQDTKQKYTPFNLSMNTAKVNNLHINQLSL